MTLAMTSFPSLFLAHLWRAHLDLFLAKCGKYCIVVLSQMFRLPLDGYKDLELIGVHLESEEENGIASMLSPFCCSRLSLVIILCFFFF